jgi:hypothetical protein
MDEISFIKGAHRDYISLPVVLIPGEILILTIHYDVALHLANWPHVSLASWGPIGPWPPPETSSIARASRAYALHLKSSPYSMTFRTT